jgi:hypothetical protein
LKEKEGEHRNVIGRSREKKTFGSKEAEVFSKEGKGYLMIEAGISA